MNLILHMNKQLYVNLIKNIFGFVLFGFLNVKFYLYVITKTIFNQIYKKDYLIE